ncbi:MAG: hypothetical protein U5L45_08235 [Saprospiraceae bacterium]|nr:hypothetical protein [Saprospiraceae bacterium]
MLKKATMTDFNAFLMRFLYNILRGYCVSKLSHLLVETLTRSQKKEKVVHFSGKARKMNHLLTSRERKAYTVHI